MTITAYRNGEPFSEHVIEIVPGHRSMEIREIRNLLHQPDTLATCIVEIHPRNYARVDMQFRRGQERSAVVVEVDETERAITVQHNGGRIQRTVHTNDDMILLDGPGPMFDWANAVMMLGICDGETFTPHVYLIDVRTGSLIPSAYTFRRTDNLITVSKGVDALSDSELFLRPADYAIDVYYSGGYRYDFPGATSDFNES